MAYKWKPPALFIGVLILNVVVKGIDKEKRFCSSPSIYFSRASQLLCLQFDRFGNSAGEVKLIYNVGLFKDTHHYKTIPFAVDAIRQQIFWVDSLRKEIKKLNLSDTTVSKAVDGLVGDFHNLALDWVSGNIYWTDKANKWIGVGSVNNGFSKILAHERVDIPQGLAVDPKEGYVFWSDTGIQKKIEKCLLDGSNRSIVITTGSAYPYDISLDMVRKRLFWMADGETCHVNYEGNGRTCFSLRLIRNLLFPFGFAYSETLNTIFFADASKHNIKSLNLTSKQSKSDVTDTYYLTRIFRDQVKVYDNVPSMPVIDPCSKTKRPCSHFCFGLKGGGYTCSCPSGMKLLADKKSCTNFEKEFGIFACDGVAGKVFSLTKYVDKSILKIETMPNPSTEKSFPIAVAYDTEERVIYWSDWHALKIFRMNIDGSNYRPVAFARLVEGMAFDPISRLLFWTSSDDNGIHIAKPDGSNRVIIKKGVTGQWRDIVLYSEKGLMFYATWGKGSQVVQVDMDGGNPKVLFNASTKIKVFWINGLELDRQAEKLYCADAFYKNIFVYDLKNGKSTVLFKRGSGTRPPNYSSYPRIVEKNVKFPFGLTINKDYLYWTDWEEKTIYGLNRVEGHWSKIYAKGFAKPQDLQAFQFSKTDGHLQFLVQHATSHQVRKNPKY